MLSTTWKIVKMWIFRDEEESFQIRETTKAKRYMWGCVGHGQGNVRYLSNLEQRGHKDRK